MTFAENELPAFSGEHWVTMGVAQTPKTTCPNGLNYTNWSYQISLPADLASKGEIPSISARRARTPRPSRRQPCRLLSRGPRAGKH